MGFIDGLSAESVTGWIYHPEFPERKYIVEISIDGTIVGSCVAEHLRDDLFKNSIGDGKKSFTFLLDISLPIYCNSKICVKEKESGENLQFSLALRSNYSDILKNAVLLRIENMNKEIQDSFIQQTGLFDASWYIMNFPDVKAHNHFGKHPAQHFAEKGWREGRNPSPLFDVEYYITTNLLHKEISICNPLLHYHFIGIYDNCRICNAISPRSLSLKAILEKLEKKEADRTVFNNFLASIEENTFWVKQNVNAVYQNDTPLVSVIMPVYNREDTITHALSSALSQTWKNIEIILVDDGSTDGSVYQLTKFIHDRRIKLIQIPHAGVCAARNAGLRASSGEYIAFLDSDNIWRRNYLQMMLSHMAQDNSQAAYCGIHRFHNSQFSYFYRSFNKRDLYDENYIDLNAFVVHRDLVHDIFFDEVLYRLNDWDFILSVCDKTDIVSYNFSGVAYFHMPRRDRISEIKTNQYFYIVNKRKPYIDWDFLKNSVAKRVHGMVSIIIPFVSNAAITVSCIKSVLINTHDVNFEIILVDNAAEHKVSLEVLSYICGIENIKYIKNKHNYNFSLGCNFGVSVSSGEYVCFLNNDTEVMPRWLHELLVTIDDDPTIGFVNPICLYPDNSPQFLGTATSMFSQVPYHIYASKNMKNWEKDAARYCKSRKIQFAYGACLLERAEDFIALEGFDPAFINGSEETYHSMRMHHEKGKSGRVSAKSVIIHHESQSPNRGAAIEQNWITFSKKSNFQNKYNDIAMYAEDGFFPVQYTMLNKCPNTSYVYPFVQSVELADKSIFEKQDLSILIVKPSGVGNMLWTMPLLVTLKKMFPMAKVDVLCFPQEAAIAEKEAHNVIVLNRPEDSIHGWKEAFANICKAIRYDIALLPPYTIPRTTPGLDLVSDIIVSHPWIDWSTKHEVDHAMDLARMLGYTGETPQWRYPVEDVETYLCTDPYVAIHIGTSASQHMQKKCWPLLKWAALFRIVAQKYHIYLITGPNEEAQNCALQDLLDDSVRRKIILKKQNSLDVVAKNLQYAKAIISIDGGIGHFANHIGIPLVMLFGPTSSVKGNPYCSFAPSITLKPKNITCAPCYPSTQNLFVCSHLNCMNSISVCDVIDALNMLGLEISFHGVQHACNICGSTKFKLGPQGRHAPTGMLPVCKTCSSFERHRALNAVYNKLIPQEWISQADALQFSEDTSCSNLPFKSLEISIFGGHNSLDLMQIDRPSKQYSWVICNHVIEHIADDRNAFQEMLRVLADNGVLQLSFPNPYRQLYTIDWGVADESKHGHYRSYGVDVFAKFLTLSSADISIYSCIMVDESTLTEDICYFITRDQRKKFFFSKSPFFREINAFLPNS